MQLSPRRQRADLRTPAGTPVRVRPSQRRLLIIWDVLVVLAIIGTFAAVGALSSTGQLTASLAGIALVGSGPLIVYLQGGYLRSRRPLGNLPIEFGRLLAASGFSVWLSAVVVEAFGGEPKISSLTSVWFAITAGWLLGRLLSARRIRLHPERTLVIGSGLVADHVISLTRRHPEHGMNVAGIVDDVPVASEHRVPVLGGLSDLPRLLATGEFDRVVVAFSDGVDDGVLAQTLRVCSPRGVRVDVVPRLFQLMGYEAGIEPLGDMSLVQVGAPTAGAARRAMKRVFDVVVASAGLALASPAMLVIAIAVRRDSPGPVFFRQVRVGRNGRHFEVLKFRTMHVQGDAMSEAARTAAAADRGEPADLDLRQIVTALKGDDDPRVTRVGRFLRRTSLDELPQLWNVVRGDMSLVGPRPLRPFEAASLDVWQASRHEVRPGVTGLWQVMGRSDVDWDRRMQMDYTYVRHWSLRQDIRVLARTLRVVLRGDGSR